MPTAQALVPLPGADRHLAPLCGHFAEHGAVVTQDAAGWHISHALGRASLSAGRDTLHLRAEAGELGDLLQLRGILAWHVEQLEAGTGGAPEVRWTGDGCDDDRLPNLRVMRVLENRVLTPAMRRVTLAGDDLAHFAGRRAIHVRLLLPPPGVRDPEWPRAGANGLPRWPKGPRAAVPRVYTLRRVDVAAGRVEVDMVVHGDEGPGTRWARRAAPGDPVGMIGPGGGMPSAAPWVLLAGDETALPAIARAVEAMPPGARGEVLIEVDGPEEEQPLAAPPGVRLRWLHRHGAAPGTGDGLIEAVGAVPWPAEDGARAWIAAEARTAEALRRLFREERGLPREAVTTAAYWRLGAAG
ncbi:siderophore-interacting protein [Roseomonas sp. OT10]|uniref:siderophore-interacting protein n=1 Tax=Roseomonas cutis TaxID=2897332 RepID=UPI001E56F56E|nr:siderophore-interacting protein [Roseomonas sp. OT10]UFN51250.1 siderophore-interacting protein [Roseomonas sp. OT10]